jgi:hypothetical protein
MAKAGPDLPVSNPTGPGDPLEHLSEEDLELGSEALIEMETSAYAREAIAVLIRYKKITTVYHWVSTGWWWLWWYLIYLFLVIGCRCRTFVGRMFHR